ncbi:acyl carrier protein [Mycobacterium haemophilum]
MPETTAIEQELIDLLGTVLDRSDDLDIRPDVALREAGIASVSFIAFLTAIETRYGFEWDEDTPPGALRSIAGLAEIVEQQLNKEKRP